MPRSDLHLARSLGAGALAALAIVAMAAGCGIRERAERGEPSGDGGERAGDSHAREPRPELVDVADGLDGPTDIQFRPGQPERLYVAEQPGTIHIVERGRVLEEPFLDIRDQVGSGGERGLLGLAFPPDHVRTGIFYVHYTNEAGDTRLVRLRAEGDRADRGSAQTIFAIDQPYPNHNGGQVTFDPQGRLLLGLGDGGSAFDPHRHGQDLRTPFAKIRRLDVRRPGARWETVAYGLRNPWRFSFDRETGDLWIGDVGQDRQEEIDVLRAGERELPNFGWSAFEGRVRYRGHDINPSGKLIPPVAVYGRRGGCSVTGGFVYRGRALPGLRGRYLYGDLCTGYIWSLRREGDRTDVRREPIDLEMLTTFGEDPGGELYAASLDGRVVALRPAAGGER